MNSFPAYFFEKINRKNSEFSAISLRRHAPSRMRRSRSGGVVKGFDAIGDINIARSLAKFLDTLTLENSLPKTILYILNPCDKELVTGMIGCFQDGTIPGTNTFAGSCATSSDRTLKPENWPMTSNFWARWSRTSATTMPLLILDSKFKI